MKYHNKEWLEKKYWEEGLEQSEIAEIFDVDDSTITRWMKKNNIPTVFGEWISTSELEYFYHDQMLSLRDIGDKFGVDSETVRDAMEMNSVDTRDRLEYQNHRWLNLKIVGGYPTFQEQSFGTNKTVKVHRLVAVAEHGIKAVEGMDVHHKNEVKWDNRPENLELKDPSDHMKYHAEKREMWKDSPR